MKVENKTMNSPQQSNKTKNDYLFFILKNDCVFEYLHTQRYATLYKTSQRFVIKK